MRETKPTKKAQSVPFHSTYTYIVAAERNDEAYSLPTTMEATSHMDMIGLVPKKN